MMTAMMILMGMIMMITNDSNLTDSTSMCLPLHLSIYLYLRISLDSSLCTLHRMFRCNSECVSTDGFQFIFDACRDPTILEEISGISKLMENIDDDLAVEGVDGDYDDF